MAFINKDYHLIPSAQRGELSLFAVAGVVEGAKLELDGTGIDTDTSIATVTVSAGKVRYDGYPVEFGDLTASLQTTYDLSTDDAIIPVYLNPPRKVPFFTTTAPNPANFEEGDFALQGYTTSFPSDEYGNYYVTNDIFIIENSQWRKIRPLKGNDYKVSYGWNNKSYNMIDQTAEPLVEATPEIPIFMGTKTPPHVTRPLSLMRQTGGILLGEITYSGGVATITKGIPDYNISPI